MAFSREPPLSLFPPWPLPHLLVVLSIAFLSGHRFRILVRASCLLAGASQMPNSYIILPPSRRHYWLRAVTKHTYESWHFGNRTRKKKKKKLKFQIPKFFRISEISPPHSSASVCALTNSHYLIRYSVVQLAEVQSLSLASLEDRRTLAAITLAHIHNAMILIPESHMLQTFGI